MEDSRALQESAALAGLLICLLLPIRVALALSFLIELLLVADLVGAGKDYYVLALYAGCGCLLLLFGLLEGDRLVVVACRSEPGARRW